MAASPGYAAAILQGIGAPSTPQNLLALHAWQQAEGGTATNNPFNTTQPFQGATNYNSVGVKNYATPEHGIQATIQTLQNGHYGNILQALHQGDNATAVGQAIANSPWGTGSGVLRVLGSPNGLAPQVTPQVSQAPSTTQGLTLTTQRSNNPLADPAVQNIVASNDKLLGIQSPNFAALPQLKPTVTATATQPVEQKTSAHTTVGSTGQLTYQINGHETNTTKNAISLAEDYLGTPYVWGGEKPGGFDCSGLLQYVWARAGVNIPRTTYDQFKVGTQVSKSQLQPGDAVFFTGSDPQSGLPGHVAMYIGNGKVIQAPHTGADVEITALNSIPGFQGARRFT